MKHCLLLFLLEARILWIVSDNRSSPHQDLTRAKLYDCLFTFNVEFDVFGLILLIRCEFKSESNDYLGLFLTKSMYEGEITRTTLNNFHSEKSQNRIEIIQTKIHFFQLRIFINNVARSLQMVNVDLTVRDLTIQIGREKDWACSPISVFELEVNNCSISVLYFSTRLHSPNSYGKLTFENTVFKRLYFSCPNKAGLPSFTFDNCRFEKALGVNIQGFVEFEIVDSLIKVPYNCLGFSCGIRLSERVADESIDMDEDFFEDFFFPGDYNIFNIGKVHIENTTFLGGSGPFFTITNDANLQIYKSFFHIQSHGAHASLIDFQGSLMILEDVLIDLTSIDKEVEKVNIMSMIPSQIHLLSTQILCPFGMKVVENLPLKRTEQCAYYCER